MWSVGRKFNEQCNVHEPEVSCRRSVGLGLVAACGRFVSVKNTTPLSVAFVRSLQIVLCLQCFDRRHFKFSTFRVGGVYNPGLPKCSALPAINEDLS